LPAGVTCVANFSGGDRYQTNANAAKWAQANAGLSFTRLAFATGDKFPDALAAGPYLAREGGILLLTGPASVPPAISTTIVAHVSEVQTISFIGLGSTATWQLCWFLPVSNPPYAPKLGGGSTGPAVRWLERRLAGLSYLPGAVDGRFDSRTYYAVIAFQKWSGLTLDGRMDAVDWAKLYTATPPTARKTATVAWVEIGEFNITERHSGWVDSLWDPCVFTVKGRGAIAIHGFGEVPLYPWSHGCVRLTVADMSELFPLLGLGRSVFVY
jgi:hypothetical protein